MYGKQLRLERIKHQKTNTFLFVTMDHGITNGVLPGLEDIGGLIKKVGKGGADAVLLHKGNAKNVIYSQNDVLKSFGRELGLIIHLNGAPSIGSDPYLKIPVCTVDEAVQFGADAVSIHVNIGDVGDEEMLEFMGDISSDCIDWGIPLIAMMYPRGPDVDEFDTDAISHCVRIGVELGADIIKTNYTGDIDSFKQICKQTPIPVVVAGGQHQKNLHDYYKTVSDIMKSGAAGMAVGRNVFGTKDPTIATSILSELVHNKASVEDVLQKYKIPKTI
ncbi:MAG: fructose-bisphosphate aldolase [Promethearchaeota archaeon]|nr:MAG: fructose-bisphosphate aldolase [Candidatus Lokiarchaeota archaeon]